MFFLQPHTIRNNGRTFEWIFHEYLNLAKGLASLGIRSVFMVDDQIKQDYSQTWQYIYSPADFGIRFDAGNWPAYWRDILTDPAIPDKTRLLEALYQKHQFQWVFCWTYDATLERFCREKNCTILFQELGMIRRPLLYQMDFEGLLWKSSMVRLFHKYRPRIKTDHARLRRFLDDMKKLPNVGREEIIRGLGLDERKPILLILLQVEDDSNIVVGSPFRSMQEYLNYCFVNIKDIDEYNVIIKKHPVQPDVALDLDRLSAGRIRQPWLVSNEYDNLSLIQAADYLFTINSSAGFEGLCYGKNVVTFGRSPYHEAGFTLHLETDKEHTFSNSAVFFKDLYEEKREEINAFLHFALFHYQFPGHLIFLPEFYQNVFDKMQSTNDKEDVFLREQDDSLPILKGEMKYYESRLGEKIQEFKKVEQYARALEKALADHEQTIQQLRLDRDQKAEKLQTALNIIDNSRIAKLATHYYKLREMLLPPGSWRRRVLQTLLRVGRASVFKGRKQRKAEHSRDSAVYLEQFKAAEQLASHRLRNWLATDHRMVFPVFQKPRVSIILLVYNKAALTFQCLETIKAYADEPFELIIVDNASADETGEMLSRLANVKIIRNLDNVGFIRGCNQGVDEATGDHLLFLNNDTQIQPGTISALVRTLDSDPVIGAVGGRLIFPDRTLQEAGSIIWRDGSCLGYGRGDNPFRGEYSFPREVHFCSGALLMTPRRLFEKLGKFDERYLPAYYEEADYCMRLREAGYQVWYQPKAIVIHYEFASGNRDQAISLQIENQKKFVQRWSRQLQVHPESQPENICLARMANNTKQRILYIDDIVPDNRAGSGYPRTRKIVEILSRVGYFVTYYPLQCAKRQEEVMRPLEEMGVEIISVPEDTKLDFAEFFKNRKGYYQIALVSRPHNMAEVARELGKQKEGMKIIYDAEAIFSLREALYNEVVQRRPLDSKKVEQLVRAEVEITKNADCILAVSEREKELFHRYGATNVHVLGHVAERCPTPASFEERRDLLFVGGILNSPSPNEDAVLFFARQIFPRIRKELNCKLLVVGTNKSKAVRNLHSEEIKVIGRVDDLFPYYNQCRLFVVPTRYSGGIPLKLTEAAAHGLPSVVTPLISQQIGWVEDGEMSVGHTDIDFADKVIQLYRDKNMWMKMRQAALERVGTEYNEEQFESKLRSALLSV